MNLRLVLTAIQVFKSTQEQYKQEADEFDKEHEIDSPISKGLNHGVVLIKIVGFSLIMGDFDFLDELIGNKWIAAGSILAVGMPMLIFIGLLGHQEKENNRDEAHQKSERKRRGKDRRRVLARREHRKKSSLVDFGY